MRGRSCCPAGEVRCTFFCDSYTRLEEPPNSKELLIESVGPVFLFCVLCIIPRENKGTNSPLMYVSYLFIYFISQKTSRKKKKITMVKPFARSSGMDISKYRRPPATPSRWARRGPIRRILFNYLNRLRKKIISALIYFISFFSLLPTRSPRNRCDRAPLTSPSGSVSV